MPNTQPPEERFNEWLRHNPGVINDFIGFSLEILNQNPNTTRIGSAQVWERCRWESTVVHRATYKLDNNFRSRVVRLAMATDSRLAGVFEIRR